MSKVWQGKHMWIWNISATMSGDMDLIISRLRDIGANGVIVKSDDGGIVWKQFRETVNTFKNAGFTVGAWGYHYGNNVEAEANAALDAISAGADWYVIDAEIEYETKREQAKKLGQILRAAHPDFPIAYSSFPFTNQHPAFPYAEFSAFCNVALPQVYWGELAPKVDECLKRTFDLYRQWDIPVCPVGQAYVTKYVPTADDYDMFEAICKFENVSGVSFWSMQHATSEMFDAIKNMTFEVKNVPDISDFAKPSVDKAIQSGVMTNDENGNFNAKDPVTREQLAIILDRLGVLDLVIKAKELK